MFKKILLVGLALAATSSAIVYAIDGQHGAKAPKEATATSSELSQLKTSLAATLGLKIDQIFETDLDGVVLLMTDRGMLYTSKDGRFVIQGKIYDLSSSTPVELAEASLADIRLEGVAKFKDDVIEYPAKNEKHVVTVFTDITCGYCRKMHKQMDEYNDLGITFRYLAYPRHGITDSNGQLTQGYKDLRSIWCHEEPATAMTKAKNGSNVAQRICDKPIEDEFNFGRKIGVTGTPAIIFPNGHMIPGYQEPKDLLERLENM